MSPLAEDGRVFVWGDNSVGQIGLGEERFAPEPRELYVGPPVTWVSCGSHHSALVTGTYTHIHTHAQTNRQTDR